MRFKYILISIIIFAGLSAFRLPQNNSLILTTSTKHVVGIFKGHIFYDGRVIYKKYEGGILYGNKANRLIEDHGTVFLFLAISGSPNRNRLNVFLITSKKATLIEDAILSPIKDYDNDGYLEFGGGDLKEIYSNPDSMYYIPSAYYEIREGKIKSDISLTKSEDIKLNGLYISPNKQLDQNGYCCKIVPTPGRKPSHDIQTKYDLLTKSFMDSDTITVLATAYVLNGKEEITNVDHFNDGSWLFYSNHGTYTLKTTARKVKLASIIKIDKSILKLSWMPKGTVATRTSRNATWLWNKLKDKN